MLRGPRFSLRTLLNSFLVGCGKKEGASYSKHLSTNYSFFVVSFFYFIFYFVESEKRLYFATLSPKSVFLPLPIYTGNTGGKFFVFSLK